MTPPAATVAGRALEEPTRASARTTSRPSTRPSTRHPGPPSTRSPRPSTSSSRAAAGASVRTAAGGRTARTATPAHRRTVRPAGPAPRVPRRVSGPARGLLAETQRLLPPLKRPGWPSSQPRTQHKARPSGPLPARLATFVRALPDNRWLDRLVRGRVWIPLLGVLLVGIVAIQVEVLKLGAGIGRSVSLATELQSRNELLRTSVARLSDDQRIMRQAAKLGMYMPGPTEVNFVPGHARNAVGKAIRGIRTPDSQTFLAALAAQVAADGVANPTLGSTGSPVPPSSAATLPATGTALSTAGAATTTSSPQTSGAATTTTTPVTSTTTPTAGSTGTSSTSTGTSSSTSSGTQALPPSSTGGAAAG